MKKITILLLAFITINTLNAQEDIKETAKLPKVASTVKNQAKEIAEATPGVISQMGTAIKDGTNVVVTGAKDATNFVDTSSNFRWMLNKTNDFVVSTAQSLKVGATQVLAIMAKKYFLMGIYAWIIVISAIIGIIFICKKFKIEGLEESTTSIFLVKWIFIIALLAVIHNQLLNAINYTFNPEYYVLQELKDFVLNITK
jgi:Na+-transporting NADH:ubiquinone oxidoreductase subunit NqrB